MNSLFNVSFMAAVDSVDNQCAVEKINSRLLFNKSILSEI